MGEAVGRVDSSRSRAWLTSGTRQVGEIYRNSRDDGDATMDEIGDRHKIPAGICEPTALFVDFNEPVPHTLMAQIGTDGGTLVETLGVSSAGAAQAWAQRRDPGLVPMPLAERPVGEVLAELADALRTTDMTWPRQDDPNYVASRALAWSRCRTHLPSLSDSAWEPMADEQRRELLAEFLAVDGAVDGRTGDGAEVVIGSLAELFLDYGVGYLTAGPLCWSPGAVALFLTDWLPRRAVLSAEQRVGLTDREQVSRAVSEFNAERLARSLLDE